MKRIYMLVALVSAVLAVPATASAFSGTVVAKKASRHAVVVVSRGGVARTLRTPRFASLRAGQRLVFSATKLGDGTFRAGKVRLSGRARLVFLRGTVVRQRASRYLLSSGGSLISIRVGGHAFAAVTRRHRAGDIVTGRVRIGANGLTAKSLHDAGHSDALELEGIFLGLNGNQLRLAVEHRGEVFVTVPDALQLPPLTPGDEIELVVTVDATGAFTLVSVQADDEGDDDGAHEDHGRVEVTGSIADLGPPIAVQPRDGSPVECAVPDGFDLSHFAVGDRVEMRCALVNGVLTLTRLKHEDDDDGGDDGGGGGD
jgi:hypothetical protein